MPTGLLDDGAEVRRAEKLDQIHLGDAVHIVFLERLQVPSAAPAVDGGFCITGQLYNILRHQNVGVLGEQLRIKIVHILPHHGRYLTLHFHRVAVAVPPGRSGVAFGKDLAVFQIGDDIRLFDFVAAGSFARVLARNLTAFQQVQRRGFADVADPIELILCDDLRDGIPVDCVLFHLQYTSK